MAVVQKPRGDSDGAGVRHLGRITTWKDDKGYGFITASDDNAQVFVHATAFTDRRRRPAVEEIVSYRLEKDEKGRLRAAQVTFVSEVARGKSGGTVGWPATTLIIVFLVSVLVAVAAGKLPIAVVAVYAGISPITYLVYAADKASARAGGWRTAESTLHFLGLIGGWPGGLVAQRVLRHKSRKIAFQVTFWLTVLLNLAALAFLAFPDAWRILMSHRSF